VRVPDFDPLWKGRYCQTYRSYGPFHHHVCQVKGHLSGIMGDWFHQCELVLLRQDGYHRVSYL